MTLFKVAVFGICAALLALGFKSVKGEYSSLISLAAGGIIFTFILVRLESVIELIRQISGYISVNDQYIGILIKVIGVSYICEFSSIAVPGRRIFVHRITDRNGRKADDPRDEYADPFVPSGHSGKLSMKKRNMKKQNMDRKRDAALKRDNALKRNDALKHNATLKRDAALKRRRFWKKWAAAAAAVLFIILMVCGDQAHAAGTEKKRFGMGRRKGCSGSGWRRGCSGAGRRRG